MRYPSESADSLEEYVRKTFPLTAKSLHLYFAMRWLERRKSGLCKTVIAPYEDISDAARIDRKSVKPALLELLRKGLCAVKIGRPIKGGKIATTFRRLTLDELKQKSIQGDDDAHRLATALSGRAFHFNGNVIKPCWTVGHTGRLCSSKPNFQGRNEVERWDGLATGLKKGLCLVYADIRQAEPTIIKHILKIPLDRDPYQEYANATGCSRDASKNPLNALAYCKNTMAYFEHWPEAVKAVLGDYAQSLDSYKKTLFAASRRTRSVTTLTGRFIIAEKRCGIRLHAGRIMNWRVQGTVADIINAVSLRLLDCASVVVPIHDGVYAVLPTDKAEIIKATIIEKAREIGLTVAVKLKVKLEGKPLQGNTPQNRLSYRGNHPLLPPTYRNICTGNGAGDEQSSTVNTPCEREARPSQASKSVMPIRRIIRRKATTKSNECKGMIESGECEYSLRDLTRKRAVQRRFIFRD